MRRSVPKAVAVYRMFDQNGSLLYVGQSCQPFLRPMQRLGSSDWPLRVVNMQMEWFPTREAALAEEARLIKSLRPTFNITFNDGKDNRNRETFGGKVLKLWMERNGMSVQRLVSLTGIKEPAIKKILNCEVQPSYITIRKLSMATDQQIPDAVYCRGGFVKPYVEDRAKAVSMLAEVGVTQALS